MDNLKKNAHKEAIILTDHKTESAKVISEYTNRDVRLISGNQALYHNTFKECLFHSNSKLRINANGIRRKTPENLVLNSMPLSEYQDFIMEASPALSISSGPYIPISECFSGSSKFFVYKFNFF